MGLGERARTARSWDSSRRYVEPLGALRVLKRGTLRVISCIMEPIWLGWRRFLVDRARAWGAVGEWLRLCCAASD